MYSTFYSVSPAGYPLKSSALFKTSPHRDLYPNIAYQTPEVDKTRARGQGEIQLTTGIELERNMAGMNNAWIKGLSNGTLKT